MIAVNEPRFDLIWQYADGTIEYEDNWGYRILMHKNIELTKGLKCTQCHYDSKNSEWYWRDENGNWHKGR